ncbi:MAG: hypothetical protein ACPGFK_00640 [Flavobacteriaceae bacterium]
MFRFQKATGVGLDALGDIMSQDMTVLETLFHEALKEGHRLAKQELSIGKEDVLAIGFNELTQYTDALNRAMTTNDPVKKKLGKSNKVKQAAKN